MKLLAIVLFMSLIMSGCSLPETTVRTVDSRPSIAVTGTSPEAELIVDGLSMGRAKKYNGAAQVLVIEPGSHRVTILDNGKVIYDRTVFVESELKIIFVH